jgi:TolB-like protein
MNRLAPLLLAAALPLAASAAPARVKVAVMDVKNVQGVPEGTAIILTDIVVSEVARSRVDVVSKGDIAAMIGFEKEKQILGCSDDSKCLAEIGGALGVDYMLTGQVGLIGSRYRISLLLVDSKKAKVAARSARFCDRNEDALAQAAQETVAELLAAIPRPEGAPAAAAAAPPKPAAAAPKPAAAPPAAVAAAPVSQMVVKRGPNRTGAWIAIGASGACVLGGVLLGLSAKSQYNDLSAQQGDPNYATIWLNESRKIERTAKAADGFYLLGVIGAGVGTWLWLSAGSSDGVAVVPVATGDQLGLVAAGRF